MRLLGFGSGAPERGLGMHDRRTAIWDSKEKVLLVIQASYGLLF